MLSYDGTRDDPEYQEDVKMWKAVLRYDWE